MPTTMCGHVWYTWLSGALVQWRPPGDCNTSSMPLATSPPQTYTALRFGT